VGDADALGPVAGAAVLVDGADQPRLAGGFELAPPRPPFSVAEEAAQLSFNLLVRPRQADKRMSGATGQHVAHAVFSRPVCR
jgi:hypothetical protein